MSWYIQVVSPAPVQAAHQRVRRAAGRSLSQDSSNGGAVETGCGDLYDVIY